jgi:hypothetical protein
MDTAKASQVPGCGEQYRGQPFCTHVIQAFPDHQDDLLDAQPVGASSSPAPLLALQRRRMQESEQAFAMQSCHLLHFGSRKRLWSLRSALA